MISRAPQNQKSSFIYIYIYMMVLSFMLKELKLELLRILKSFHVLVIIKLIIYTSNSFLYFKSKIK
jgi:hypothetical protein